MGHTNQQCNLLGNFNHIVKEQDRDPATGAGLRKDGRCEVGLAGVAVKVVWCFDCYGEILTAFGIAGDVYVCKRLRAQRVGVHHTGCPAKDGVVLFVVGQAIARAECHVDLAGSDIVSE